MKKIGKVILSFFKWSLLSIMSLLSISLILVGNFFLPTYSKMLNNFLGYQQEWDNSKVDTSSLDLQYNVLDYTKETIKDASKDLSNRIASEGVVLLENKENSLPLKTGQNISFFGVSSSGKVNSSGLVAVAGILGGSAQGLKESFETAGFGVNSTLWDYYAENSEGYGLGEGSISFGDSEDFSINELPLSKLQEAKVLDSAKDSHPVFVMKRVAGEGRDMPRSMYNHTDIEEDKVKSYLEPDSVELELLSYLNSNFDNVTLLLQTNAALELDWLKDFPNIKSVVFAPTIDANIGKIFSGEVNPSGRTVDTFATNALASPAAQNIGSYLYYDESGQPTVYNYISYLEGIYVGYKYYETRYEDVVLGQGNAGSYDYNKEVVYPFGFGLSYTEFEWSNFKVSRLEDEFTVTVDVKNIGDVAGKDVVEIFAQSPYTDYDKTNKIEKSSVDLVGYTKTKELAPDETEKVEVKFSTEQLKAYDSVKAKTYIMDAGDYFVTAASDAHNAINNILKAKGAEVNGNESMVHQYTVDTIDTVTYAKDNLSGEEISNKFDDARGESTYLTRNDWVGSFPKHDGEISDQINTWGNEINGIDKEGKPASYTWMKKVNADLISELEGTDSGSPIDPAGIKSEIVYGAENGRSLIEMRGLDFDDEKWQELLDQLTADDYYTIIVNSGYGTEPIESVGKPFNTDADTASRLVYGGAGGSYPNMITLAQTWNRDLALELGEMIGNEALIGGADGWYAPSMNIHRTPFSGRNGEYYSEDPFLSGTVAALEVKGAALKGMYTFIKHFALNDQENHRGDRTGQYGLVTWANEQSIRELYLKPFEMVMKNGTVQLNYLKEQQDGTFVRTTKDFPASMAVMTAFNRIGTTWTGGSYNLITGVLRNEWDFDGFVITDNANTGVFMDTYQMIEAGGDAKLLNAKDPTSFEFEKDNVAMYHYAREAAHRILYTIVNSKAMNGVMPGSIHRVKMQPVTKIRIALTVIPSIILLLVGWYVVRCIKKLLLHKKGVNVV